MIRRFPPRAAAGARVDDDEPRRAEVAAEAEPRMPVLLVGLLGQVADRLAAVARRRGLLVGLVLVELGRREVAEVLVDPVGHQAADHAALVPVGLAHLVEPGLRGLPLVVDLVVVEDHRGRQRREHPADDRVGPDVAIADRVLLEVLEHLDGAVRVDLAVGDDLLDGLGAGRRRAGRPASSSRRARSPWAGAASAARTCASRRSPSLPVPPALEGVRRLMRRRGPAGAEEQSQVAVARDRPDPRMRELVALRRPRLRPSRWTS